MDRFLFLHVPQIVDNAKMNRVFRIASVPMGFYSMAGELRRNGSPVEIIHLGVELIENEQFAIEKYIADNSVSVVALDLHWYQQTKDVLEIAKKIKLNNPETCIVLGGYTASAFPEEILHHCSWVDVVIKGEGEVPLTQLVPKLFAGKSQDLSDVPNLWWRNAGNKLIHNSQVWVATGENLDSYDTLLGIECLRNRELVLSSPIELKLQNNVLSLGQPTLHPILGRGCPGNCAWCGGGHDAALLLTGRKTVVLRQSSVVADEIVRAWQELGIKHIYTAYDPYPHNQQQPMEIFRNIGKKMPGQILWDYECFGLPTQAFAQSFQENLSAESSLIISPDFADEDRRYFYKSFAYSNEDMYACLDYLQNLHIKTQLCFLECQEKDEVDKREKMFDMLSRYDNIVDIRVQGLEDFEPFAPWTLNRRKYEAKIPDIDFEYYFERDWR